LVDYLDKISAQKCLILNTLVRYGSVSTAAKALKLPVSKVHNELKAIERAIGSPIILRDKRKIVLTPIGAKLAEFSRVVVESLKLLDESSGLDEVTDINIATTHGLAETFLPEILAKFHIEFPKVHINLFSGLEYLDFTQQDIDIVIGPSLDNRSDLTKTYICDFTYAFYASKEYIARKGLPQNLNNLARHEVAMFKGVSLLPKTVKTPFKVVVSSTNYRTLLECTRKGLAIGFLCKEFLDYGFYSNTNLVSIIPEFISDPLRIHFMSRKFTNKSIQINKLQEITLESMRAKPKREN